MLSVDSAIVAMRWCPEWWRERTNSKWTKSVLAKQKARLVDGEYAAALVQKEFVGEKLCHVKEGDPRLSNTVFGKSMLETMLYNKYVGAKDFSASNVMISPSGRTMQIDLNPADDTKMAKYNEKGLQTSAGIAERFLKPAREYAIEHPMSVAAFIRKLNEKARRADKLVSVLFDNSTIIALESGGLSSSTTPRPTPLIDAQATADYQQRRRSPTTQARTKPPEPRGGTPPPAAADDATAAATDDDDDEEAEVSKEGQYTARRISKVEKPAEPDLELHMSFALSQKEYLSCGFEKLTEVEEGLKEGVKIHVPSSMRHTVVTDSDHGLLTTLTGERYSISESHVQQCLSGGIPQMICTVSGGGNKFELALLNRSGMFASMPYIEFIVIKRRTSATTANSTTTPSS